MIGILDELLTLAQQLDVDPDEIARQLEIVQQLQADLIWWAELEMVLQQADTAIVDFLSQMDAAGDRGEVSGQWFSRLDKLTAQYQAIKAELDALQARISLSEAAKYVEDYERVLINAYGITIDDQVPVFQEDTGNPLQALLDAFAFLGNYQEGVEQLALYFSGGGPRHSRRADKAVCLPALRHAL